MHIAAVGHQRRAAQEAAAVGQDVEDARAGLGLGLDLIVGGLGLAVGARAGPGWGLTVGSLGPAAATAAPRGAVLVRVRPVGFGGAPAAA
ncbi:MAG: hypothetical protein AVDCRST_MAG45-2407, partial [uncultured Solirubrobacterales bacterium]